MKIDPLKEYEISKKRAYENVILSYWMRNFWDGRAVQLLTPLGVGLSALY